MARFASVAATGIVLGTIVATACNPSSLPGTMLGTYNVTGALASNTCGNVNGAAPPNPWTFTVQMSEDGTTLYWQTADDSSPLSAPLVGGTTAAASSGTIIVGGSATFLTSQTSNVDGQNGTNGPCNLQNNATFAVALASSSPPATFTGTITYTFSIVAGSVCSDQLTVNGGTYDTLPCTTSYTVTGALQ